ncbi:MAG: Gfo/Idh/MocA family oxidoreductase [Candidatus Brocadiae bacterium]|nr:Gfo/Idh/MocA family oxidoreductase [Candidatus Brocadiia bacterium]
MTERVRIGLIGVGGFAQVHVGRLQEVEEASISALVDPDPNKIAAVKKRFPHLADCPAYDGHKEMLEHGGLEAAVIASPHHVHCEQIVDSLRAGLHVLTEKPMVCTIEDAHKVMEEEQKAGKLVALAYQRHAQGEFQFVRKCIESGAAGEVQFLSAFQGQNWMKGVAGTWRQILALSGGGQLNDSGSHLIDIILWVTGLQVSKVCSAIRNFDTEVDINSALTLEFTNGAVGTLSVVGNCPVWWEDITINCSEWSFFLRQDQLTYCTGDRGEMLTLQNTRYGGGTPDRNFVNAILGREEVLAPSVCGLRTIELTEAAWKSAEMGEPVSL